MNLKQAIEKILTEWPQARKDRFGANPLALFIRSDFPSIIHTILGNDAERYTITGSAGAGNWASVPWLAVMDSKITRTTTKGFYPVYLFREDMSGVYLSLNQGTTEIIKELKRKGAMEKAKAFALHLRSSNPQLSRWIPNIELRSSTPLGSSYEEPNIGAKFYPKGNIPDNSILESDLKELLSIYQIAINKPTSPPSRPPEVPEVPMQKTIGIPKPFLLLAGISGTGKTKWVLDREIEGHNNVEVIPVRPDWHEPTDLLGYISRVSGSSVFVPTAFLHFIVRAWRNAWNAEPSLFSSSANLKNMMPFWLCLDEMNLAPVEQYFADYLSVLEQRKWVSGAYQSPPLLVIGGEISEAVRSALGFSEDDNLWTAFSSAGGIPLPPNLIVVGTVNMDETTHGFSRKVLDRALTVEFDAIDFSKFGGTVLGESEDEIPWTGLSSFTDSKEIGLPSEVTSEVLNFLEKWNAVLAQTSFRIAYRTINESLLIAGSLVGQPVAKILDWIAMTKLLPRLEGDENKLGMDREGGEASYIDDIMADWSARFGAMWPGSHAKRKLDFMSQRLKRSGYTSFWP
ncbi:MAG: DUF3578 domain-containing protein [Rectinemataceae bacterium]|nr:DUF3578 domain-containing protein [Rectinemataceae bacterium]